MTDLEYDKCNFIGVVVTLFDLYDDTTEIAHFNFSDDYEKVGPFIQRLLENGYSFNIQQIKSWEYEYVKDKLPQGISED